MNESKIPPQIMVKLLKLAEENNDLFKHLNELEGLIIRAHLIVEKNLNRIIEVVVINPSYRPEKFSFSQKLEIAKMLGAIVPEFESPIRLLNKLRNQIAHSFHFDSSTLKDLTVQISKNFKNIADVENRNDVEIFKESIILLTSYLSLADHIAKLKFKIRSMKESMDE